MKLNILTSITVSILLLTSSCRKDSVSTNENQTDSTTLKEQDANPKVSDPKKDLPEEEVPIEYDLGELNPFLNGSSSNYSTVNSSDVIIGIWDGNDVSNVYYFTTQSSFETWLSYKSYNLDILTSLHVMDSIGDLAAENDTNEYSYYSSAIKKGGHSKSSSIYRVSSFGAKLWEHCFITAVCGGSPGASYYIGPAGFRLSLGWMNNKASAIDAFGSGSTIWCMDKNFKGKKFIQIPFGVTVRHNLVGGWNALNDNIESAF